MYGVLILILVVGGGLLQFHWMQNARKANTVPDAFAEKLARWMMLKKGLTPEEAGLDSGVPGAEKLPCQNCLETGSVLADGGGREICPVCLGVGFHLIRRLDSADRICPNCAGMGRTQKPGTGEYGTCPRCDGRGLVRPPAAAEPAPVAP